METQGIINETRRAKQVLRLIPIPCSLFHAFEKRLQDQNRRHLIDHFAMSLSLVAGLVEDLVGFSRGEALVPQMNGQAGEFS